MGTSAGPSLQGIGRGGASNLVLEIDAHDAKSYPGEPTSNILSNPNNWTGSDWTQTNGTVANNAAEGPNGGSAGSITATNADPYIYSNLVHSVATGGLTFSCWVKGVGSSVGKSGDIRINFNGTATGSATTVGYTLTGLWQRVSISGTVTGAGTIKVGIEPPNSAAVGDVVYLADAQLEQKGYATPFVREGNGGTGTYNARPASVNLMIHGNVGTGTTFEDSSPSKLTVTNNNSVTHSAVSKFNGGSIKFVRSSSQQLTTASTSNINFGTGNWTIDFWFNITNGSTDRMHAVSCGTGNTNNLDFNFNDASAFWLYWNGVGGNNVKFGSDGDYGDGQWHHCAATRYNGMVRVWIDGVHKGSNNYNSSTGMGQTASIYVGGINANYWDGYLDEVRVCKGTALWVGSGNFTPPIRRNLSAPVVDRSGSNNGGNFNTTDMTDVATYRDGQVIDPVASAVWDFDGTDDEINMGHAGGAFKKDGIDRTIAQWVMSPTATATYMSSLGYRKSADETGGWMIYWRQGYIRIWAAGGSHSPEVAGNTFAANTIYHVVATWPGTSGQTIKLYINGEYISAADGTTGTSADSTSNELSIGRYGANSGFHYTGKVYNTQIYDTILTAQQIKENFNQQRNRFGI